MNKKRIKMPASERAKQFVPFSALKGLDEALRTKEKVKVKEIQLSEERMETISRVLSSIQRGDLVKTVYYSEGEYVTSEGLVTMINKSERWLYVVKIQIPFESIYEISVKEKNNG